MQCQREGNISSGSARLTFTGNELPPLTFSMPSKLTIANPSDPRFSERAFRAVEQNIADFVRNYPLVTEVRHPTITLASLSNRLRNGLTGFLIHRYSSDIDPLDCEMKWQDSVIRYGTDCVVIGPRDASIVPTTTASRYLIEWNDPTEDVLSAIATLYSYGRLQTPSCVTFTATPPPDLTIPNAFSRDFERPNCFVIL